MTSPLEEMAKASIDIPELARGVCGEVEVEGLESVRMAHIMFLHAGWKRQKRCEGWSRLEHRVYVRGAKSNRRWLKMTIGNFLGVFGQFEVSKKEPY